MPNAIIGWDRMRLLTTRQTFLTGDVKTVAALNVMQIAPFLIMDTCYSDMLDPGFLTVTILRQEMAVSLLVLLLCQPRSLLARDNDPMDYDMPEDLNAAMLFSPRTHPTTVTSLVPPLHDIISDQDTKTRKGDDIMFLQPTNLGGPAGVEAPATSRRGPRKRLYSGHHRRSTKSDGARPPDRK